MHNADELPNDKMPVCNDLDQVREMISAAQSIAIN
jgi:hypothetical protein